MSTLSTLSYPRTGKRGVPQQFPRRLYEMLESEAKLAVARPDDTFVISWSESGNAFRILDVEDFATAVLPRYFRTKKFSSFQRNLNLYGFAKVRRGPDTDMYAHPSFIRSEPDLLVQLRKCSSASRRLSLSKSSSDDSDTSSSGGESPVFRSVSPSPPREQPIPTYFQPIAQKGTILLGQHPPSPQYISQKWVTLKTQPVSAQRSQVFCPNMAGTGKLDLLALAIERAA